MMWEGLIILGLAAAGCVTAITLRAMSFAQHVVKDLPEPEVQLFPYQLDATKASCRFCNGQLFDKKQMKKSPDDDLFCDGATEWCDLNLERPHMHRYCAWCKASWLEAPAHESS